MDVFQIVFCHLAVGLDSGLPRIRALGYVILIQKGSSKFELFLERVTCCDLRSVTGKHILGQVGSEVRQ